MRLPPPTDAEVATLVAAVARRVERLLGAGSTGEGPEADTPTEPHGRTLAAALPVPPAVRGPAPIRCPAPPPRTANLRGFSLHADRHVHKNDRLALEHLLRYGLRPPLALDRLDRLPDGRVRYRMKRTFSDGTREVVLAPEAFLARLAALVPPPRVHLVRYHGVFAPASQLRSAGTRGPDSGGHADRDRWQRARGVCRIDIVDVHLGRHWTLGVSAGYNWMADFSEPIGARDNYSGFGASVGLGLLFGKGAAASE